MKTNKSLTLAFLALLFYFPLTKYFLHLRIPHHFWKSFWQTIFYTCYQSLLSVVVIIFFALLGTYLLPAKLNKFQSILFSALTLLFFLPILLINQILVTANKLPLYHLLNFPLHPLLGIVLANLFYNLGAAIYFLRAGLARIPPELLAASELDGCSRFKRFFLVELPLLKIDLTSLGLLLANFTLTDLGTILLFGDQRSSTLESSIYQGIMQVRNPAGVYFFALAQLIISLTLFLALVKRSASERIEVNYLSQVHREKSKNDFGLIFLLVFTFPILIFIGESGYRVIFNRESHSAIPLIISISHATSNSLRNALIASLLSVTLAWLALSSEKVWRGLNWVYYLPIGFSQTLLSVAAIASFGFSGFALRNSWLITPLYESVLTLPILYFYLRPAWLSIEEELIADCELSGGDYIDLLRFVIFPLLRTALTVTFCLALILSLSDFVVPNFLTAGNQSTLTVLIYQLLQHGNQVNLVLASKISFLLIIIITSLTLVVQSFQQRLVKYRGERSSK